MRDLGAGAFALVLLVAGGAAGQVSPGPLSEAHAHLEGIRHCRDCHAGGGSGLDAKCLECHQAIAWTIESLRGLHGREGREDCADCHPEHAGLAFDLVEWGDGGRVAFDHGRTGWALAGGHAGLECERCHRAELRVRSVELRRPRGAGGDTHLGLSTKCAACHEDVHAGRLGVECEQCHTVATWRRVEGFDHARTGYVLRGRHEALDCIRCHENGRFGTATHERATKYLAPMAHDECSACHRDPHTGRFGPSCSRCHVETDFRTVPSDRFDHDRTRYPLRGAHVDVACARCHEPARGGWGEKPSFDRCGACHADAHAGTARLASRVVDCDACHDVGGFRPSIYGVARHAEAVFPLTGRHAAVPCAECHRRDEASTDAWGVAAVDLRPDAGTCTDCHEKAHGTQFDAHAAGGACDDCHTTRGWSPSTFTIARHDSTSFPLTGAHAGATCQSCHADDRTGLPRFEADVVELGASRWSFRLKSIACESCHLDVHRGRYLATGDAPALGPCSSCHDTRRFAPSSVDVEAHDRFGFRLEGAHRATPCALCHRELAESRTVDPASHALLLQSRLADVVLWDVPTSCRACHGTEVPR